MTEPAALTKAVRVTVLGPNQDLLGLFREILTGFGYTVETHADAQANIDQLVASHPDLIIVDSELRAEREQLTGTQIIHAARTSEALRDVPIIVCTVVARSRVGEWPDVMQRGDVHFLEKPFDLETARRVIETALGLSHGATDAPGSIQMPSHQARKVQGH